METRSIATPVTKTDAATTPIAMATWVLCASLALPPFAIAQNAPPTPEHVAGNTPYPFPMKDFRDTEEKEALKLPSEYEGKLSLLSADLLQFLLSDDARRYTKDQENFEKELAERSAEELLAWADAIYTLVTSTRYQEGRDPRGIQLNTDSPEFNAWRLERPRSMDPAREPGPIELSDGIPTFGGFPLALTPEDLKAGEVDVAIVGAPLNMGSGWRDSGPEATIEMRVLGRALGRPDQYVQIDAGKVLNIVDYGDIAIDNASTERSMKEVRRVVREIVEAGAVPVIIGGDHSLEYPNVAALADVYGKEKLSVIHFDSHYDAWWGGRHLISHGAPVYRLINEGHVRAADYIQVGLRSSGPDEEAFRWMREVGLRYHTMAEVEQRGWDAVLDRVVAEASEEGRKLHISFDIDVIDPAFTVATGTPVPGGLDMRESITIVRRLCAESNVVSFDLVELHPALDPTYRTTLNSAHIVKACLTGLAMREKGLTAEHYLHPITSEHAVDDYYGDQAEYLRRTKEMDAANEAEKEARQ